MADNAERVLKILLKLTADTGAGERQTTASLQRIKQEAQSAAEATSGIGSGLLGLGAIGAATAWANLLSEAGDAVLHQAEDEKKITAELDKQLIKWLTIAQTARDFGDVVKLANQIAPALAQASARFDEINKKSLGWIDTIKNGLTTLPFISPKGLLGEALDNAKNDARRDFFSILADFNGLIDKANSDAERFKGFDTAPMLRAIADAKEELAKLQPELDRLNQARVAPPDASDQQLKDATKAATEYGQALERSAFWTQEIEKLEKQFQKAGDATEKAAQAAKDFDISQLDPDERLPKLNEQLDATRDKLRNLGIERGLC